MSKLQTVKTAGHEIVHAKPEEERPKADRHTREVRPESMADPVCPHYGPQFKSD
jgi:hypothetical protein